MQQKLKVLKASQLRLVQMHTPGGSPTVHIVTDENLPWPLEREVNRLRHEIGTHGIVPIHAITKVLKHKGRDHDLLKVYVPSDRTPSELVKRLKALLGSTRPLKCQAAPADPKKDRYRPVNRRHMLARAH